MSYKEEYKHNRVRQYSEQQMHVGCMSVNIKVGLAQKRSPYTMTSPDGITLQAPQSSTGIKKRHHCADKKDRRESW